MNKISFKLALRGIRSFWKRYLALVLIVMLSVGFFSGLKITKNAMYNVCDGYFKEQNFCDFQLYSTLGFRDEDVETFSKRDDVDQAEGMNSIDALIDCSERNNKQFTILSFPKIVNKPSLVSGRMPEADDECVVDSHQFSENDIGKSIKISDGNKASVKSSLKNSEYKIVGLVNSPLYIGADRGTTQTGNGKINGFIYIQQDNFKTDYFSEIDVKLKSDAAAFSSEYDELIDSEEPKIKEALEQAADDRYNAILDEIGFSKEVAEEFAGIAGIEKPEVYVLTRDENVGCVSFKNDTGILSSIANVFPVFFVLIALLVCVSTMSRMVDEERTQIGTLKAMGFSDWAIIQKYLFYAGSATILGWLIGFFAGIIFLPKGFWLAYKSRYDFAPMKFIFSPTLAVVTLFVALAVILISTWLSCRKELKSMPAVLIRPKAAKSGKRILLERFTKFWKNLPFLRKITLRNMFLYKKRMILMIIGIGCCTGLVVTAFGVRDSMVNVGNIQFSEIQNYQYEAYFDAGREDAVEAKIKEIDGVDALCPCVELTADAAAEDRDVGMSNITMLSFSSKTDPDEFFKFNSSDDGSTLSLPKSGEAIVSRRLAEKLGLSVGDSIQITQGKNKDRKQFSVKISGIFTNYINNYVVINDTTYLQYYSKDYNEGAEIDEENFNKSFANTLYVKSSAQNDISTDLTNVEYVEGITNIEDSKEYVDDSLDILDSIIWLLVLFSGALEFIVIFNLTIINFEERSREIATVSVLGFYPRELRQYVLSENVILSVLAGLVGMPIGVFFHRTIISMIKIDAMTFQRIILPSSFVEAFILTIFFAMIVNLFMRREIKKIHMAEALKAVE